MGRKICWEEMFADEFTEALENFPVCYMPVGTLERHGTHLTFGLDSIKAHEICKMAAERYGGIVMPPLYLGTHGYFSENFRRGKSAEDGSKQPPGSVYISESTLFAILLETFREIDYSGFELAVVYTGHYPREQRNLISRAAEQYMDESSLKIWTLCEYDYRETNEVGGDHAAKWETSFMMALRPELVDISKAPEKDAARFPFAGKSLHEASAEIGTLAAEYVVKKIGEKCAEVLSGR